MKTSIEDNSTVDGLHTGMCFNRYAIIAAPYNIFAIMHNHINSDEKRSYVWLDSDY